MLKLVHRPLLLVVLTFALCASQWAAAQGARIVVFGTSLSDPGNAFALRGGTNTPPDYSVDPFLVPNAPYARGGHHFSNGPTWIEQYARPLGLAGSVRPALASSGGATNYAVGGARAREEHINYNLPQQVGTFLADFGGAAPSDALYVVEMGGNDLRDALAAFVGAGGGAAGEAAAGAIIADALGSIGDNMGALYVSGARKFLVWNAPNIGLTPAIRGLDALRPGAAALAAFLSAGFNAGLEARVLRGLEAALPGIVIVRLDVNGGLTEVVANPAAFGLTNVTTACITPNVAPFHCDNVDDFLFWDGIHPTAAGHAIIAQRAAATLGR